MVRLVCVSWRVFSLHCRMTAMFSPCFTSLNVYGISMGSLHPYLFVSFHAVFPSAFPPSLFRMPALCAPPPPNLSGNPWKFLGLLLPLLPPRFDVGVTCTAAWSSPFRGTLWRRPLFSGSSGAGLFDFLIGHRLVAYEFPSGFPNRLFDLCHVEPSIFPLIISGPIDPFPLLLGFFTLRCGVGSFGHTRRGGLYPLELLIRSFFCPLKFGTFSLTP